MENDNSKIAGDCKGWLNGRWAGGGQDRLYQHPIIVLYAYHWLLTPVGGRWECDDFNVGVASGDFWKVFVR